MPGPLTSLLHAPARITAVAGVTLIQLVRMRLFLVPGLFILLVLGLQFIPYQQNISIEFQGIQQLQLLKDICTGCMQLFGLMFCIAATALLIPRDSEDRILYTILCKPVPKFDYLAGKLLGVLALLALMLALMDGLMSLLLLLRETSICEQLTAVLTERGLTPAEIATYLDQVHSAGNTLATQQSILAMALGFTVLSSLTLLFSCFTSGTIVSIIFGIGAYFIGMFQDQFILMLAAGEGISDTLRHLSLIVAVLLPDFGLFSITDGATAGVQPGWSMIGGLALIAGGYVLLHLLIATWVFSRKEF